MPCHIISTWRLERRFQRLQLDLPASEYLWDPYLYDLAVEILCRASSEALLERRLAMASRKTLFCS